MIGMISCKEATYLISKKEEGKITMVERLKLSFHLMMCRFCKMFEKQNNFIAHHTRQMEDVLSPHDDGTLPDSIKEKIKRSMN